MERIEHENHHLPREWKSLWDDYSNRWQIHLIYWKIHLFDNLHLTNFQIHLHGKRCTWIHAAHMLAATNFSIINGLLPSSWGSQNVQSRSVTFSIICKMKKCDWWMRVWRSVYTYGVYQESEGNWWVQLINGLVNDTSW